MSYEEYVNEEAMELTEETVEATQPTEEEPAENAEVTETVEAVEAEAVAEESVPAEEAVPADADDVAEEITIEYSVEEPLTVPTVDEELFDASAEEEFDFEVEGKEKKSCGACDSLQAKCDEVRTACKDVINRLSYDLEQTNYNPYIRSTTTYKYEILKKSTDTEPVDVFEFQRTSGFSLRAMAITTVLVAAADVAVSKLLKKKMK